MMPQKYPDMDIICKRYDGAEELTKKDHLTDLLQRDVILRDELSWIIEDVYAGAVHAN